MAKLSGDDQAEGGVAPVGRAPRECRPDVVLFRPEPEEMGHASGAQQLASQAGGQGREMGGVRPARSSFLAACREAFHPEFADRFEHGVAWLVVTRRDASGIVFGLARPMRDTLRDMRRTSLGNLALGLLLIAASFAVILPLASRLTRHITALTDGVQRLAHGDRRTRVEVDTSDEVGELARSFNRMASELESHEQMLVKQERLARELELCRQIQNDMLPHGPLRIGLAEIAGVSIPAREVGGDFFNYFPLHDGRIALLVGDVSGKGVGAALLMANIQATLRARLQLESDLARLADEVDHDVEANTPPEVYITLFVAILDPPRRELRYVNAGHNPQFLLRANGGIERLESTGLPVGLLPGRGFEERAVQVDPGDLLFLYTDGAVEAPNEAGDMFDADRLQQALVAASAAGIDEVLVSVEQAIRDFRGNAEPADDATMMALRLGKPLPVESDPTGRV
jgi:sigma-B regulation protein RsbU (phosphoserine phosphatase)